MSAYLLNLHVFVQWFAASMLLCGVFFAVYVWTTPLRELQLIREGNISAALCLCGALLGYALPLASALAHGVDFYDFLIWAIVALFVQLAVYVLLRLLFGGLSEHVRADRRSVALVAATISLGAGLLNAAAIGA